MPGGVRPRTWKEGGGVRASVYGIGVALVLLSAHPAGAAWRALGAGANYTVNSLTYYDGKLFAGGDFTAVFSPSDTDTVLTSHVASWDGTKWAPLKDRGTKVEGTNAWVWAEAVYQDSPNKQPRLYVGGHFSNAGGLSVPANCIASWSDSSTTWSRLSGGMDNDIYALCTYKKLLVAGGLFTQADSNSVTTPPPAHYTLVNHVAAWSPSLGWRRMPVATKNGMDGTVWALTSFQDSLLIAAGEFQNAASNPASYIAKWNGTAWSALGAGADRPVYALTVFNGELIAAGDFSEMDGQNANFIAAWNGSSWAPVGPGTNGPIFSLAVYNGALIAGGAFTQAGGNAAIDIAAWDGTSWTSLGTGLGEYYVQTLAPFPPTGELVAGGSYLSAGDGTSVNFIARWSSTAPKIDIAGAAPRSLILGRSWPNPFSSETSLAYSLLAPGHVLVTVHDPLGRQVATLVDRLELPGDHAVLWNGRDDSGRELPNGVYFTRLQTPAGAVSERVVRTR